MESTEIYPLNRSTVTELLIGNEVHAPDDEGARRRSLRRWPFPGTVQLWVPDENGIEELQLATCVNLSLDGAGLIHDEILPEGLDLTIAIHQPEASFQGRATIRHCTWTSKGYFIGLQFLFDD